MPAVGLIIGHGYAKAVCGAHVTRFPAVAALATAQDYESALGRGPALVHLNGQGSWLIGEEALLFAPQRIVTILDRARYRDASFVALARRALSQVALEEGALAIMTGMPGAWYADTSARSTLEAALRAAAAPWGNVTIRIAPEAAGVFYAYVFEHGALDVARTRGTVGVIDAGYRDVNVCLFQDGRYVAGESVPGGVVDALRQLKRRIADAYGLELSLHEVDACVHTQQVRVAGGAHPLPAGSKEILRQGLPTLLATARSLWPNGGKTLEAVVLGGGGAVHLGAAIWETFPQTVVQGAQLAQVSSPDIAARMMAADVQLAGARGFAAAAAAALRRL
jgi:hypothetical protein